MIFAKQITEFLFNLHFPFQPADGIQILDPFRDADTKKIVEAFYTKFYNDDQERWMIMGINPGRFGGGVTGIPFTDPIRLQSTCYIENLWAKKQELSSLFVYDVINAFGNVESFYKQFYITAVSPLGFTKDNKNLNYYDDKSLLKEIKAFATDCIEKQLTFGIKRNVAFCLGDGKNFKFLSALNSEMRFFKEVIPLSHPRFIMQYKLKSKTAYINYYLSAFKKYCV